MKDDDIYVIQFMRDGNAGKIAGVFRSKDEAKLAVERHLASQGYYTKWEQRTYEISIATLFSGSSEFQITLMKLDQVRFG